MPIYEFYCPDNNTLYSFFARSLAYSAKIPRCPDGANFRMEREISRFAITGRAREKPELPGEGAEMDDPRMQSALAQMEREMSGLDTDNPDPKMLARMMRRMSELTGERVPQQMDEMMCRMEAGEDIERLEAEYGDAFDALEAGGEAGSLSKEGAAKALKARILKLRGAPLRDPMLYDMSEYVEL
jgi:hypothetical protein